ncbi:MAG TPA: T9SS type A sorting domain-containing protein [Chitinophagaceae bacterium]|nr:T9SS type A sorting domain-containing protein [Chitinophagaceae bacterium]
MASLIIGFAFTSARSYGHGSCNVFFRYSCEGKARWNAAAALFSFGVPISVSVTWYQCYPYYTPAEVSRSWGYQYTKYTAGVGCIRYGWKKRWYQSRGEAYSPLVSEFIGDMIEKDDEDYSDEPNSEEAKVVEKEATIDDRKRTITVSGIDAACKVLDGSPVYSLIRYEIWQGRHARDTVYDSTKVIYKTQIRLNGIGERAVEADGAFASLSYKSYTEAGYRNLVISTGSVVLPIPSGADTRYLGLRLVSDGGGDEKETMRRAIESSEEALTKDVFSFEVFPNPASDRFTIRLQSQEAAPADIRIFDGFGKLVSTLPAEQLSANRASTIEIDASGYASGTYYIVIRSGDKKYVKHILITR